MSCICITHNECLLNLYTRVRSMDTVCTSHARGPHLQTLPDTCEDVPRVDMGHGLPLRTLNASV